MTELFIDTIDSEIGPILVVSDGEKLCALDFAEYKSRMMTLLQKRFKSIQLIEKTILRVSAIASSLTCQATSTV